MEFLCIMAKLKYNQFSYYSHMAGNLKGLTEGKVLVDLKKLDSLENYNEILDFITTTFGEFDSSKDLDYPNDVKVHLQKLDDVIIVYAMQKEEQIFGSCWRPAKEE